MSATSASEAPLGEAALALAVRAGEFREEQRLLLRAEHELTRRCMAGQRFAYPPPPAGSAGTDDPWHPDLDLRGAQGSGLGAAGPSPASPSPAGMRAAQRPAYRRALSGDDSRRVTLRLSSGPEFTFASTGCIAEGRRGLYGDVMRAARAAYVPQEAYNALYPALAAHPAVRAAEGRWAACMRRRGQPFASMQAARSAVARGYRTSAAGVARRTEVVVAVADGECALEARLPETVAGVAAGVAVSLTAEQRHDLTQAAAIRSAALGRARALVAG
ncbi:hypothetical protein K1W54_05440 [Micromonospora sp. CPCC 205371]|nr:hypothetical protein [Micromonospora sp. CPCC 205371]